MRPDFHCAALSAVMAQYADAIRLLKLINGLACIVLKRRHQTPLDSEDLASVNIAATFSDHCGSCRRKKPTAVFNAAPE